MINAEARNFAQWLKNVARKDSRTCATACASYGGLEQPEEQKKNPSALFACVPCMLAQSYFTLMAAVNGCFGMNKESLDGTNSVEKNW